MSSCEQTNVLIERFLEGEAAREDLAPAETHAATCPACAREIASALRLAGALESALAVAVPAGAPARVIATLRAEPAPRARPRRASPLRLATGMAMAAAILLFAGVGYVFSARRPAPPEMAITHLGYLKVGRTLGPVVEKGGEIDLPISEPMPNVEYSELLVISTTPDTPTITFAVNVTAIDGAGTLSFALTDATIPTAGDALTLTASGAIESYRRSTDRRPFRLDGRGPALSPTDVTSPTLLAKNADGTVTEAFPLEHTDVRAEISGFLASTTVEQRFSNPYDHKIEAVYCFPLPHTAAVNDFLLEVGGRRIRGIVREREEAKRVYEKARAQGQVATLLEQERPNVFVQSVANLEPMARVAVKIRYFHTLPCDRGTFSYVFPMVVGHRYGSDARAAGHSTVTPPRLPDGVRSGHEVSLSVTLDAAIPIEDLACATHEVEIAHEAGAARATVRLSEADAIPDRDLVITYRLGAKDRPTTGLLAHAGPEGRFFTLLAAAPLVPPARDLLPRELFFVIDASGSMEGTPLAACKRFVKYALARLRPDDVFTMAQFSDDTRFMSEAFLAPTPGNVADGMKWVDALVATGGTEAEKALRIALEHPRDPRRERVVVFMTDGGVSFEEAMFARIKTSREARTRIFTFGANAAPNRHLLDTMASLGRGAATYIAHDEADDAIARKVDDFYARLEAPVLTDVSVDWGGLAVEDVYPRDLPDLFAGRPLALTGRFRHGGEGTVTIRGRSGAGAFERKVAIALPDAAPAHDALAPVWARAKIQDLSERLAGASAEGTTALTSEVRALALEFNLASTFTSFVAVDEASKTGSEAPRPVDQPVEIPAGVDRSNFGPGK